MSEEISTNDRPQTAYDEHLYPGLVEAAAFQAYEYLNGDKAHREAQKQAFLAGETDTPELDYPDLQPGRLDEIEATLLSQKQALLAHEQQAVVKQAYRWKLNEKLAEVRLLKAASSGDMRRFQRYSEFVFGRPSPEVFAFTIHGLRARAESYLNSDENELRQAATTLLNSLAVIDAPAVIELPAEETVHLAHDQTIKELGDLISLPPDVGDFDAEQIQAAFADALDHLGAEDWEAEIDTTTSRSTVSVNQENKKATVAANRRVKRAKLEGLLAHEILTHVGRRLNGERSRLKLLGLGLDRYLKGEEGVATLREQALASKLDDFAGLEGHLAIGLAIGLDGQPRNFRQVYEILEQHFLLNNLATGKATDALEKAQTSAWNRTIRTFRGSDCKTPGACFTQDIAYREGNIGVWNVAKNNPAEMMRISVGKYDPANPRHIWILEQLGITDQDLADLEA